MARALGVTTSTLWRKETGGTEFKASELVAIAKAYGVDVSRLMVIEAAAVKRTRRTAGGDRWRFLYAPSTLSCPTTSAGCWSSRGPRAGRRS
jgi:transcriptional regulator with XRE-family HTH domain